MSILFFNLPYTAVSCQDAFIYFIFLHIYKCLAETAEEN